MKSKESIPHNPRTKNRTLYSWGHQRLPLHCLWPHDVVNLWSGSSLVTLSILSTPHSHLWMLIWLTELGTKPRNSGASACLSHKYHGSLLWLGQCSCPHALVLLTWVSTVATYHTWLQSQSLRRLGCLPSLHLWSKTKCLVYIRTAGVLMPLRPSGWPLGSLEKQAVFKAWLQAWL